MKYKSISQYKLNCMKSKKCNIGFRADMNPLTVVSSHLDREFWLLINHFILTADYLSNTHV